MHNLQALSSGSSCYFSLLLLLCYSAGPAYSRARQVNQTESRLPKIQSRSKDFPLDRCTLLTEPWSYFNHFEGHQDCGITSMDLYMPPLTYDMDGRKNSPYCGNRAKLLEAMSGGGRHGFEAPYSSVGCHYRWYSTSEICMILERFDAIVFIGDEMIRHIYAGINMLLRENIAMGSLKQWQLKENERAGCRCENQLIKPECSMHAVTHNLAVRDNDAGSTHKSPYHCDRKGCCIPRHHFSF